MTDKARPFQLRSKLWIEDDSGQMVFGLGRYRILDAVDRLGSLQAAARELKMSYRAVWCRVHISEERLGKPLVVREGKGSRITGYARDLMKQFRRLQAIVHAESDEVYETLMADRIDSGTEPEKP